MSEIESSTTPIQLGSSASGAFITSTAGTISNGTIFVNSSPPTTQLLLPNARDCWLKTDAQGDVMCGSLPLPYPIPPSSSHPDTFASTALVLGFAAFAIYRSLKMITVNGSELKVNIKLTRKQMITYGVTAYLLLAVLHTGYFSTTFNKEWAACIDARHDRSFCNQEYATPSDRAVASFGLGLLWPIYWPYHIAYKLFE